MKKLILAGILGLLAQVQAANVIINPDPWKKPVKKIKVRVTAYWPGQDYWTSRFKSSTGYTLKCGKSCAVDPRLIPYGSTVVVAGREFRAIDTGSAVKSRKASRGKYPIVDLFFASEKKAKRELATLPKHAWVEVKPK